MTTPAPGYRVEWTTLAGHQRCETFTGDGFSLRAKELVGKLIAQGEDPVVYAVVVVWRMTRRGEEQDPVPLMIDDNWAPVVNHMLVKQQEGELLQDVPRGKPRETLAQLRERIHAAKAG